MQPTTDLDGSLGIRQRRLQPVGLVSVLPGLLLGLLQFTPQFGQRALQGRLLSLELFAQLNLHVNIPKDVVSCQRATSDPGQQMGSKIRKTKLLMQL